MDKLPVEILSKIIDCKRRRTPRTFPAPFVSRVSRTPEC